MARVAILVEGESDRGAVLALTASQGIDLLRSGVIVVAMGGITNIARYVTELGPRGKQVRLTGLYDAGEERFIRRGLEVAGTRQVQAARGSPHSDFTAATATSRTS